MHLRGGVTQLVGVVWGQHVPPPSGDDRNMVLPGVQQLRVVPERGKLKAGQPINQSINPPTAECPQPLNVCFPNATGSFPLRARTQKPQACPTQPPNLPCVKLDGDSVTNALVAKPRVGLPHSHRIVVVNDKGKALSPTRPSQVKKKKKKKKNQHKGLSLHAQSSNNRCTRRHATPIAENNTTITENQNRNQSAQEGWAGAGSVSCSGQGKQTTQLSAYPPPSLPTCTACTRHP